MDICRPSGHVTKKEGVDLHNQQGKKRSMGPNSTTVLVCVCVWEGNAHAQTKARAELEYFTLKQNKNVFHAKISQR